MDPIEAIHALQSELRELEESYREGDPQHIAYELTACDQLFDRILTLPKEMRP